MKQMKFKDERLKLMSEILNGMKVIKFYAWENSMQKLVAFTVLSHNFIALNYFYFFFFFKVLGIREKEISILREIAFYNAAISLTWSCAPFLVAVVTFGLYVNIDPQHNQLTPQVPI